MFIQAAGLPVAAADMSATWIITRNQTMIKTPANSPVPESILRKLHMVRQRKLLVHAACAVVAALAVLLAAMCVAMLIDWLATLYDSRWRVVLTMGALLAAVATTLGWFAVAWRRALGVKQVAGDVDRQIPQLEERWTTMTRLGEDAENPSVVHPAMLRRVATEAVSWEPHVEPTQVVSLSTLMRTMIGLTAITAVLAIAVVMDTRQTFILMRRFWAPGSSISATQLVDVPGDVVVGRGEPLALVAKLEGTPVEQATLFLNSAEDERRAVKLVAHGEERVEFSHRMRAVEEPFEYRFRAGDGQTDWYKVNVAERPEIAKLQVTVTPPDYTGRAAQTFDHLPRRISAMEKSTFELALQSTIPVERAELQLDGERSVPLVAGEKGWLKWTTTLEQSLSLTPILTESHGLTNRRAPRCDVAVYPDKPPAVKVLSPDDEMAVRPDDTIDITFSASDDVGIGSAELLLYESQPGGEPVQVAAIPIPLDEATGAQSVQETVALDLNKFAAQDGAELSYEIRVREQRGPVMPQTDGQAALLASNTKSSAASSSQATADTTGNSPASNQQGAEATTQSPTKNQAQAANNATAANRAASRNDAPAESNAATPDNRKLADTTATANDAASSKSQPTAAGVAAPDNAAIAKSDAAKSESPQDGKKMPESNGGRDSTATANNSSSTKDAAAANSASAPTRESTAKSESSPSDSATVNKSASPNATAASNAASPDKNTIPNLKDETAKTSSTPTPGDLTDVDKPKAKGGSPADGKSLATPPPALPPGQPKPRPGEPAMANTNSEKSEATDDAGSQAQDAARTATSGRKGINSDGKTNPDQQNAIADNAENGKDMAENPASEDPVDEQQAKTNRDEQAGANQQTGANQQSSANQQASNNQKANGNQQAGGQQQARSQQSASSNQMASKDQKPSSPSDQPPGDSMPKRMLDVESQTTTSQRMRLKVDKWAGSFSGQQRGKLEMAIAPDLEALDELLAKAERTARGVMQQLKSDAEWRPSHEREVTNAEKSTADAQGLIDKLQQRTKGTPYAFVGLQVVEIGLAHVEPARNGFWKALESDGDGRSASVSDALQHLARARALLKDLRGQFERTRREFQLAESVEKVKKMYQVYVENSLALLQTQDSDPNRYNRKMAQFELDDEYLKRLKEVLEMRAELQKELARILGDDPRLLRRFMDSLRNRSNNLREELAGLVEKQNELNREVRAWALVDEANRPQIAKALLLRHAQRTTAMATAAGKLQERYETWLPLNREVKDADLAAATQRIQAVARAADELNAAAVRYVSAAQPAVTAPAPPSEAEAPEPAAAADAAKPQAVGQGAAADGLDPMLAGAQKLYDELSQLDVALRQVAAREDDNESAAFAANRLVDTRKLIADSSAWLRQMKAHKSGNYTGAAEVDQYRLAMKTEELAGKLGTIEQQLAAQLQREDGTLPQPIADKSREFLATLDREASPNQLAAVYALHGNVFPRATDRQQAAGTALEKAEKQYDELMKLAIEELDKLPVQDPIADLLDDPTLDELLAQLEQENQLEDLLGIPLRPSNLRVIGDWMRPGQGGGGGGAMAQNSGAMMRNQVRQDEQRARQQLNRQYQRAIARALKETEKMPKIDLPKPVKLSDWNKLLSDLGDDIRQGRDKAPPEQYRRAIEQYFSQISRAVAENENAP
jgi:hypothetical protein